MFDEYSTYSNDADTRYELVSGELIPMSFGTESHRSIAEFLHGRV